MGNDIKLAVFDIAGTVLSDKDFVAISFTKAFQYYGIDLRVSEITPLMGYKKTEAIKLVLQGKGILFDGKMVDDIHSHFVKSMINFYAKSNEVEELPGASYIFKLLKSSGIYVSLNSGFPKVIVEAIVDRMGWLERGLIDSFVASDEVTSGRPSNLMIELLMKRAGITKTHQVLKIGDTMVDIEEGRNANAGLVIGITTGAYTRNQLQEYNPDYIIDSLFELEKHVS
jgi:phosphonatase-like hydrolase